MASGRRRKDLILLAALSLGLRLGAWCWVAAAVMPPLFDEAEYLQRASAWGQVLSACRGFETPSPAALHGAYGDGRWPPLHPLLLGVVSFLGGGVAASRLVGVVLSVMATGLIYWLGLRLAGRPAALVAAAWHALSPTFIAYSHLLWAENLAIALSLGAVLLALGIPGALARQGPWRRASLACGALLGAAALTRAALLPWLVVLPAWLALHGRRPGGRRSGGRRSGRRQLAAAGLCLAAAVTVLAPWQLALRSGEGRWLPLTTLGGYNLALGNHPRVPAAYGSSWGHEESKSRLHEQLRHDGERLGVEWQEAAAPLAWQEIRRRPLAAVLRIPTRLWLLWAPDVFPPRHLLNAVYPPMPPAVAGILLVAVIGGHLALLAAAVAGWVAGRWRRRGLITSLLLAALVPPAATIALTRLQLPLEALLLPVAASAVACRWRPDRRRLALLAAAATVIASLAALPRVMELYWIPSAHYAPLIAAWSRPLTVSPIYSDRLVLSRGAAVAAELEIRVVSPRARLAPPPGASAGADAARSLIWPSWQEHLAVEIFSVGEAPVTLEIRRPSGAVLARLEPIRRADWRRDVEVLLALHGESADGAREAIHIAWQGGGRSPR